MAEDTPRIFICSLISVKKVVPSALIGGAGRHDKFSLQDPGIAGWPDRKMWISHIWYNIRAYIFPQQAKRRF